MGMALFEYESVLSPYGFIESGGMFESYDHLSLEKLYEKQKAIESRIDVLRTKEPPKKRGRKSEYKIWVDSVQDELDDLREIRDLIVARKKELTASADGGCR